jgi:hypothetical protein
MTPTTQKSLFEFVESNRRSRDHISSMQLDAYQEATRMKALRRAFLGGGSIPLGLNEDGPTITVVAPQATDKHDGTYGIPNR